MAILSSSPSPGTQSHDLNHLFSISFRVPRSDFFVFCLKRRLDILQRPRMLPYGRAQKPTSPAAAGEQQDVDSPASLSASTDPSHTHFLPSAAAAAARADDGMAGSSLRAEAETLSLLPGRTDPLMRSGAPPAAKVRPSKYADFGCVQLHILSCVWARVEACTHVNR